jgi:hypothetical protein
MSKISHWKKPPLEVNIMFEPHRLQHDLLREAYAYLLPETKRRFVSGKRAVGVREVQPPEYAERKSA